MSPEEQEAAKAEKQARREEVYANASPERQAKMDARQEQREAIRDMSEEERAAFKAEKKAERQEARAERRENFKSMSREERQAARAEKRDRIEEAKAEFIANSDMDEETAEAVFDDYAAKIKAAIRGAFARRFRDRRAGRNLEETPDLLV